MVFSIVSGLFAGVIYGLLAVGLVLIYQVSRTINFAASSIGVLAAFFYAELVVRDGWPIFPAIVLGTALAGLLGAIGQLIIARPLKNRSPIAATLATFGYGELLYNVATARYGTIPAEAPDLFEGEGFRVGSVYVTRANVAMLIIGIIIVCTLTFVSRHSRTGLRLRATALDAESAIQIGVRTDRVALGMWTLAAAVTGLAAILISQQIAFTTYFMTPLMLSALIAALMGGLTSVIGAFVGGIVLGGVEGMLQYLFNAPGAPEAILAVFVVAVLVVRPLGLRSAEY